MELGRRVGLAGGLGEPRENSYIEFQVHTLSTVEWGCSDVPEDWSRG